MLEWKIISPINKLLILLFLVINYHSASSTDAPIVETSLGKIQGNVSSSFKNRPFDTFTNIPYAEPPVEHLRFKAPVPKAAWNGVYDATKKPAVCSQYNIHKKEAIGVEDCLILNVYRPRGKTDSLLPVVFYIHGGAFLVGSSGDYDPKYMMDKDIILVLANYRINAFGFLSTGDKVVSGNMGLKDQNLALNWTVNNIQSFGGDPKNITLWGCSAGGASVHYHFLSPLSKDLFGSGISMSGSALVPWAFAKDPLKDAQKVATILNCPTNNTEELTNCLRGVPADKLSTAVNQILLNEYLSVGIDRPPFRPVAEKILDGYFINDSPENIIRTQKIHDAPWIAGSVANEGIIFTYGFLLSQTSLTYIDENWPEVGAYMLFAQDEKSKTSIAERARNYYEFDNKRLRVDDYDTLDILINLVGDRGVIYPSVKSAVLQANANTSPVYLYRYSYRAEHRVTDMLLRDAKHDFGVCHCDDANSVMKRPNTPAPKRPDDLLMQEILIDMVYSVVTKGKPDIPNVEWPSVDPSSEEINYLHVGGPGKIFPSYSKYYGERIFWKSLGF